MTRIRKHRRAEEPVADYWQSIADALTALLLVALLLVSVLVLVIANNSGWLDSVHPGAGGAAIEIQDDGDDEYGSHGGNDGAGSHNGNGGSGTTNHNGGAGSSNYTDPDPGKGDYQDKILAAVRVTVVDAETQQPIKIDGITFKLLNSNNAAMTLAIYYPQKASYKEFATDGNGVFFLPEKLKAGRYYLHQLTAPKGYDLSKNVRFDITQNREWGSPLEVTVALQPCKNVVRIHQIDTATKDAVAGGKWKLVAAKDITTVDGTVRYTKGEVVDTFRINSDGYGQSAEVYLGAYELQQVGIPEGYAAYNPEGKVAESADKSDADKSQAGGEVEGGASLSVSVEQKLKGDQIAPLHTFAMDLTRYTVRLMDEETKAPLAGAKFALVKGGKADAAVSFTTSKDGVVTFAPLDKGVEYAIQQVEGVAGYQLMSDIKFSVDDKGLIDGSPYQDVTATNYIVRVSITAAGAVLHKPVAGTELTLRAADGTVVEQWVSRNTPKNFEGLQPGEYTLEGPEGSQNVTIADAAGTQHLSYTTMTVVDIAVLVVAIVAILAAIGMAVMFARRRSARNAGGRDGRNGLGYSPTSSRGKRGGE